MVFFNYSTKEITGKIVYYGPGLCGKTTNLQYIYKKLDPTTKGKMLSLATEADRTLFFDFLPVKLGTIRGMKIRFQLYTVPGQVFYNETRKLVLKGADAIVFVADSQETMIDANVDSYKNMEENLSHNGLDPDTIPLMMQYNKRDLPEISSIDELDKILNKRGVPYMEAIAIQGKGVIETFQMMGKILMNEIVKKHKLKSGKSKEIELPKAPPVKQEVKKPEPEAEEKLEVYHSNTLDEESEKTHELDEADFSQEVELEMEENLADSSPTPQSVPIKNIKAKSTQELEDLITQQQERKFTPAEPKKEVPKPSPAAEVSAPSTSLMSDQLDDITEAISQLNSQMSTLTKEIQDMKLIQKQFLQELEKQKNEIIASRPEVVQSWFSKKIFRL